MEEVLDLYQEPNDPIDQCLFLMKNRAIAFFEERFPSAKPGQPMGYDYE